MLYTLSYMLVGTVVYSVLCIVIQFITYRNDLRQAKMSVFDARIDVPSICYDFWVTAFVLGFLIFMNVAEAGRIGFVKHVRYPTWKAPYGCLRRVKVLSISNQARWQERVPRQMLRALIWGLVWAATFGSLSVALMYWALETTNRGRFHWTYGDLEWIKGYDGAAGSLFLFPLFLYLTAFTCEEVDPTPAYVHKRPRGMHAHHDEKGRHHDCDHSSSDVSQPVERVEDVNMDFRHHIPLEDSSHQV